MRFELIEFAWKAKILPLNYIRIKTRKKGLEPL